MNIKLISVTFILSTLLIGCGTKPPQNRTNSAWDSGHCDDLLKQMDKLKGKPARRTVILDRYEMECQNKDIREGMKGRY